LITPENALKIATIRPTGDDRAQYRFDEGDLIVNTALEHGVALRGHTLVWADDKYLPGWMFERSWTRDSLCNLLRDYIRRVLIHYQDKIGAWDVVNEAFNEMGALRDCLWLRVIGSDYVELAFRWANEVIWEYPASALKLFYNDYAAEGTNLKWRRIQSFLEDLLQKGIGVDGVGFQCHLNLDSYLPPVQQIIANIGWLGDMGMEAQITEFDVEIEGRISDDKRQQQAAIYRNYALACLTAQNCNVFVVWGISDLYSWKAAGAPLLFDAKFSPKPAYYGLLEAVTMVPK
jgi:endo-1,4-beta-xylanase